MASARSVLKHLYEEGRMTFAQYEKIDRNLKEPKQGEWIDISDGWQEGTFRCSSCQMEFVLIEGTPEDNEYNFCPNCGADMRVKNELNRVSKELNSEIEKSKSEIVPDYRDGWRLREGDEK